MLLDDVLALQNLPVELLHDIQLLALSEHLPFVSKRIYQVFEASSSLYRAKYIFYRLSNVRDGFELYTKALRYPCCGVDVLEVLQSLLEGKPLMSVVQPIKERALEGGEPIQIKSPPKYFDLPRRLFKNMGSQPTWTDDDAPLPYLQHLFDAFQDSLRPNPNANNGYALIKAVHVQSLPLVQYLLHHGASPKTKDCLAVMVAIRQKNLALVKMLIERQDTCTKKSTKKRRRLEDRVKADAKMLKVAVQCKARDIIEYLCHEKGVVPDMQTLQMMT